MLGGRRRAGRRQAAAVPQLRRRSHAAAGRGSPKRCRMRHAPRPGTFWYASLSRLYRSLSSLDFSSHFFFSSAPSACHIAPISLPHALGQLHAAQGRAPGAGTFPSHSTRHFSASRWDRLRIGGGRSLISDLLAPAAPPPKPAIEHTSGAAWGRHGCRAGAGLAWQRP